MIWELIESVSLTGIFFLLYLVAEVWHHYWSISLVRQIDEIYRKAKLDREVDIIDHPPWEDFKKYWEQCSDSFKQCMREWSDAIGANLDDMINRSRDQHISEDFVKDIDPGDCVPMTLWFRTYNSFKIWRTWRYLRRMGFRAIYKSHVHMYYHSMDPIHLDTSSVVDDSEFKKPLLIVFPQFSGEFQILSVFAELRTVFDVLFVSPLGTQCSWSFKPGRYTDALEQYLPIVLQYDKISIVSWSAGNLHFQALDRYLHLKGLRHKVQKVIRLDPLGYPASNFLVFSGIPLSWFKLRAKFMDLCTHNYPNNVELTDYLGSIGFAFLLKTCHGYAYLKQGRMLRGTKLSPAPYVEHHFCSSFDPCWARHHPIFENDRSILCKNVIEHHVDGFHGLWLNKKVIRSDVFPILTKQPTVHKVHVS